MLTGVIRHYSPAPLPPKDPPPGLWWLDTRAQLIGPGGSKYFEVWCKDTQFPYLTGKLISASPELEPTMLVLAIADGDTPDVTLQLDGPLPG